MNKKTIITIIICLILMVSGYFLGTYLKNTIDNNKNNQEDKQSEKEDEPTESNETILNQLMGEWGTCKESYCFGIIVNKNDKSEYTYFPYTMWSEAGSTGTIKNVTKTADNKYTLTIHFPAFDSEEISSPEETIDITIDYKDISSRIIYINDTKYDLVVGDREEFYQSRVNY